MAALKRRNIYIRRFELSKTTSNPKRLRFKDFRKFAPLSSLVALLLFAVQQKLARVPIIWKRISCEEQFCQGLLLALMAGFQTVSTVGYECTEELFFF